MTLARWLRLLRPLALALAAAASARASLWVSADGDDRNPGTEEAPVRTLEKARDLVRLQNHDMADDIAVFLAGSFPLDRPLTLGPEDGGSNGYNVIFMPAPGAHPVITGGRVVTGWSKDPAAAVWSAPAPAGLVDCGDLFVNGNPARRTRGRLPLALAAPWRNLADVVFEPARPGAIWSERLGPPPLFAANAYEFLGPPGEWYFDRPGRRIYYAPRPGETLTGAEVVAAAAPALLVAAGTPGHPVNGLIFKGIRFEYTTQLDPWQEPAAAVRFSAGGAIQLLEDEFIHLGTPALALGPDLEGARVDGCLFGDIAWSALQVSGASQVRLAGSRITYAASRHGEAPAVDLRSSTAVAIEHVQIDHIPRQAVRRTGLGPGDETDEGNLIAPPLLQLHGTPAFAAPEAAEGEVGLPAADAALAEAAIAAPLPPDPPDDVSAEAEDEFAYVTWVPTGRDGGSPVTAYLVTASTGAQATVSAADFEGRGYMVFDHLPNGQALAFTVAAVSAAGPGTPSLATAPVKPLRKRKLRPPPPPAAVSITPSRGGLEVRITPAAGDGGAPVVSYAVVSAPDGTRNVLEGLDVIRADAAHPVVRRIEGFPPERSTAVAVTGTNAAGEGDAAVVKLK